MERKWLYIIAALLVLGAVAGCGQEEPPTLTLRLPADTPPDTVQLIQTAAPAMERLLPGLLKYQGSMSFDGVDAHFPYSPSPDSGLPEDTTVTWLKFVVADDGGAIPKQFRAWGHHLRIGIADSGDALILQKTQAKSVFLDRDFQYTGNDLVIRY